MKPTLDVIPARPLHDTPETTDLLVRLTAPTLPQGETPPLDLVLAIDASGSMGGQPIELARDAALQVFHQRGRAHLGLVTFSSEARVAAPLQYWGPEVQLYDALHHLRAGGSTALHAGWSLACDLLTAPVEARDSVRQVPHRLQRVLLLTDGRANIGLRDPRGLAAEVRRGLAQRVSTSTVGLGRHYDEQLLETLASEGDGSYHYAETPQDLEGLFLAELGSLKTTFGRLVSLGIEGVEVLDVLNDLPRLPNGRLALPPLQGGRTLDLLVRVRAKAGDTANLRVAWTGADGVRHTEHLEARLPQTHSSRDRHEHPEVVRLRGTLQLARLQRHIADLSDRGRVDDALVRLGEARGHLHALTKQGIELGDEFRHLDRLQTRLQDGDHFTASKLSRSEAYRTRTGRK